MAASRWPPSPAKLEFPSTPCLRRESPPPKPLICTNNVNAYHSRLKQWLNRFNGVATKNLPNYLGWRRALEAWGDNLEPPNWIKGATGNGPYQRTTLCKSLLKTQAIPPRRNPLRKDRTQLPRRRNARRNRLMDAISVHTALSPSRMRFVRGGLAM
jgi:hypothetical protein